MHSPFFVVLLNCFAANEYFVALAVFSPPFLADYSWICLIFFVLLLNVAVTIKELESAVNEQNQGVWGDFCAFCAP
jgi:hypothetical protein